MAINSDFIFKLTGTTPSSFYHHVQANFTPPLSLNSLTNDIRPSLLQDNKFYTPAFIVAREREYFMRTSDFQKYKFEKKMKEAQEKLAPSESLSVRAVEPSSKFCQICRICFESYQEHAREQTHIKTIKQNQANKYIKDLCQSRRHEQLVSAPKAKSKKIGAKCKKIYKNKLKNNETANKMKTRQSTRLDALCQQIKCSNSCTIPQKSILN